jgi:hypothetical protein
MKDPLTISAAASGSLVAVGLGHVAGVPVDSLVFGLMGGIVAILAVPPKRKGPAPAGLALYAALAGSVLVSVLVAAAMGPLTAAYLHIGSIDPAIEVRAFSFLWAAGAQAGLLVTAIDSLRRRIDQLGGKP